MNSALKKNISTIFKSSIKEDKIYSDITTKSLINNKKIKCTLLFKEKGILCGKKIINYLIREHFKEIKIVWKKEDGELIKKGSIIATIHGPANKILPIERILLNFLQRMSGIATLTYSFSKALKNKNIKLLDTRKTTPGWRLIDKYCVRVGGGVNHRMNLSEMILIKDNHIKSCGGITSTLEKVFKKTKKLKVEIEVKNLSELKQVLGFKVKRIMLDNFTFNNTKKAIKMIRAYKNVQIEVSGGINLKKLKKFSTLDIDFVSIGAITHSAKSIDISMNVKK